MTKNLLAILGLGLATSMTIANSAQALTANLSWTGVSGYSLTGSFTGADSIASPDGFIRATNASSSEISAINISFFKPNNNSPFATYNTAAIKADAAFNFNYRISLNSILQNGSLNSPTGFSLGNSSTGYSLDSGTGSGLNFNDNLAFNDFDGGGTLTASVVPVPFEFNPALGLVALGALWLGDRLKKK